MSEAFYSMSQETLNATEKKILRTDQLPVHNNTCFVIYINYKSKYIHTWRAISEPTLTMRDQVALFVPSRSQTIISVTHRRMSLDLCMVELIFSMSSDSFYTLGLSLWGYCV